MSRTRSDERWHMFWAVVVVVSVVFPLLFGGFLLVFQSIPLTHPVVVTLFVVDFFAILIGWHYSLKYVRKR